MPTDRPPVRIRTLTPEDSAAFRDLRLRALREHPEAFATSEEEERQLDSAAVARRLESGAEQVTLGAFDSDDLVGMAALIRAGKAKLRHRATLAGMYVIPEVRGGGVGQALLQGLIAAAGDWRVSDIVLAVTVGNGSARELYARAGFVSYCLEPRALLLDGRFHDVEHMILQIQHGT